LDYHRIKMEGKTMTRPGASADPIFAAIERHRAARASWDALPYDAKDAELNAAAHVAAKAFIALGRTVPSTRAGVLADLEYILSLKLKGIDGEYVWQVDEEEVDFPSELFRSLHTAMARLV
jgi:hypothetical protein